MSRKITACLPVLLVGAALLSTQPVLAQGATEDEELQELLGLSLEELKELKVSVASKREEKISEAPGAVSVLTAKDIKRYGAKTVNDALRLFPGVMVWGAHSLPHMNISVRGQNSSTGPNGAVLILLNGRPIRDNWTGGLNSKILQNIPMDMIRHIEMVRGPGSVLYGTNAVNGVVNIVTKTEPDSDKEATLSAGYGSFNTRFGEASGGVRHGDLTVYAGLRSNDSDGWTNKTANVFGVQGEGDFYENNLGMLATVRYKGFSLDFFRGTEDQGLLDVNPQFNPAVENHDYYTTFIDAGYKLEIGENWDLQTNFGITDTDDRFVTSVLVETLNFFYENTLRGSITDQFDVLAGFNVNYWDGSEDTTSIQYNLLHVGSFLQGEYAFTPDFKAIVGAQFNRPQNNDLDISPRVALVGRLNENWSGKLMYGEAFRQPYPSELFLNIPPAVFGNTDLEPQKIKTTEAQISYENSKTKASVGVFMSDLEEPISIVSGNFQNAPDIESWGVEFDAKHRLTNNFTMEGSFLYQKNEDGNGLPDAYGSANVMAKMGGYYESGNGVTVGVFNQYIGEGAPNPAAPAVNPSPNSVNLLTANINLDIPKMIGHTALPESTLSLYVDNILDEDHRVFSPTATVNTTLYRSGRAVYGKLSIKF